MSREVPFHILTLVLLQQLCNQKKGEETGKNRDKFSENRMFDGESPKLNSHGCQKTKLANSTEKMQRPLSLVLYPISSRSPHSGNNTQTRRQQLPGQIRSHYTATHCSTNNLKGPWCLENTWSSNVLGPIKD